MGGQRPEVENNIAKDFYHPVVSIIFLVALKMSKITQRCAKSSCRIYDSVFLIRPVWKTGPQYNVGASFGFDPHLTLFKILKA